MTIPVKEDDGIMGASTDSKQNWGYSAFIGFTAMALYIMSVFV